MRQQLYYIRKRGYHLHICKIKEFDETTTDVSITQAFVSDMANNLKGWINYIHSIEPSLAEKYYAIFNEIEEIQHAEFLRIFAKNKVKFISKL